MSIAEDVRPRSDGSATDDPAFDRTPPQDIAAEQSVLGGMLLSKDAIADVVEILRPSDFYRPAHATIFDAILDLYGRGEPADPITVAAALADSGDLGRVGGSAVPAHADRRGADRGERRLLRADRRRAGRAAPPGGGRHPRSSSWATAPAPAADATSTTSSTSPSRPSTTSPSAGSARTSPSSPTCCSRPWTRSRRSARTAG